MNMELVVHTHDILGEAPTWCARRKRLFWSDVRSCSLRVFDPETGSVESLEMPDWIGSFALTCDHRLLLASRKSLLVYDPTSKRFDIRAVFEADQPDNRSNDGRTDREGRFWWGTLNNRDRIPTGHLYCFDGDGMRMVQSSITVPNALAWSPDGQTMYFADSWVGDIWAFDFDPESGAPSNRRVFLERDALPGIPDGASVDSAGCLWHARYGAGKIARVTPDGHIDRVIDTDTLQLTACTFGGSDLRELYITSARQRMSAVELAQQPYAGAVFKLRVDTPGLSEPRARI
ncbi:MAG: SMP-30/gluconolactonase/LRE family protein [Hyphomicrobiaceae bacterium]